MTSLNKLDLKIDLNNTFEDYTEYGICKHITLLL